MGGHVFCQAVLKVHALHMNHTAHTGNLAGSLGSGASVQAGHQHMDLTTALGSRGHGIESCRLDAGVVVFSNDKSGHGQITFASFFNLSTRAATSATLTPALRLGGSLTLSVLMRGCTFTPRSSGLKVSICFFLAFMMLGSVT